MSNQTTEQKLIEQFKSYDFIKMKKELLHILKELYGSSKEINTLADIVYKTNDEANKDNLIKVYTLLMEALEYSNNKQKTQATSKLNQAYDLLEKYKQQEEAEKREEQISIEEMINNIDKL